MKKIFNLVLLWVCSLGLILNACMPQSPNTANLDQSLNSFNSSIKDLKNSFGNNSDFKIKTIESDKIPLPIRCDRCVTATAQVAFTPTGGGTPTIRTLSGFASLSIGTDGKISFGVGESGGSLYGGAGVSFSAQTSPSSFYQDINTSIATGSQPCGGGSLGSDFYQDSSALVIKRYHFRTGSISIQRNGENLDISVSNVTSGSEAAFYAPWDGSCRPAAHPDYVSSVSTNVSIKVTIPTLTLSASNSSANLGNGETFNLNVASNTSMGWIVKMTPQGQQCDKTTREIFSGSGNRSFSWNGTDPTGKKYWDDTFKIEAYYTADKDKTDPINVSSTGVPIPKINFEKLFNQLKVKPTDLNRPWTAQVFKISTSPNCILPGASPTPTPDPSATPTPTPPLLEKKGTGEQAIDFPPIDGQYLVEVKYDSCVTDLFKETIDVTGFCIAPTPTPVPTPTVTPTNNPTPEPSPSVPCIGNLCPNPSPTPSTPCNGVGCPTPNPTTNPTTNPTIAPTVNPTTNPTPTNNPSPSSSPSEPPDDLTMNYIIGFGSEKDYSNMGNFDFGTAATKTDEIKEASQEVAKNLGKSIKPIRHVLKLAPIFSLVDIYEEMANPQPVGRATLVNVNLDDCEERIITGAIAIPELLTRSENISTTANIVIRQNSTGKNVAQWTVPVSKTNSFSIKWNGKYNTGADNGQFVEGGNYHIVVGANNPKIKRTNSIAPVSISVSDRRICDKDKYDFVRYGSAAEALEAEETNQLSLKEGTFNQNKWIALKGFVDPSDLGKSKNYTHEIRIFVWNKADSLSWLNQGIPTGYWLGVPKDDFFGVNSQVKSNEINRWGIYPSKLSDFNLKIKKIISVKVKGK